MKQAKDRKTAQRQRDKLAGLVRLELRVKPEHKQSITNFNRGLNMNTYKIKTVIGNNNTHSYIVVAMIDGKEVITGHKHHTDANQRCYLLRRDHGGVEL
jgi:hypothetical protein